MAWNKELEAEKILKKEKEQYKLWVKHKDGRPPTPYTGVGYQKESAMCADWYAWAVNSYNGVFAKTLAHIANENTAAGQAGAITGSLRAAMGVLPGYPDYNCVALGPRDIRFFEAKLPGETLSKSQIILHEKWSLLGIEITVGSTFTEWRAWCEDIVNCYNARKYGEI